MTKDFYWFKAEFCPHLKGFDLRDRHFESGDSGYFGDLDEIEMTSSRLACAIDFWSLGYFGVHVWDFVDEKEVINVLLEPSENFESEQRAIILQLGKLLDVDLAV